MAMETVKASSLPVLTGLAYAEAYRYFLRSLVRGTSLPYLKRTLPSLGLPPADRPGPVRILSIGPGTGDEDLWLIRNVLLPHNPNLQYDAIEPNPDHFEAFKKKALDENISSLHLHNLAFEDFPPPSVAEHRYDLVLLIHSLYYLAPTALPFIFAEYLAESSGSIVVILDSPVGFPALQKSVGVPGPHDLHLDDALEGFARKEIVYVSQWMDVEEVFGNTPAALHLLGFIVVRDLTAAPPELLEGIRRELQARVVVRNGRRMYWLPEGVGIVLK